MSSQSSKQEYNLLAYLVPSPSKFIVDQFPFTENIALLIETVKA